MTMQDDSGDRFATWCHFHGQNPEHPDAFAKYIEETTGWDGQQFSLTEAERHWIKRANEVVEWLRLYAHVGDQTFLDSALRTIAGLGPMPGSLQIE